MEAEGDEELLASEFEGIQFSELGLGEHFTCGGDSGEGADGGEAIFDTFKFGLVLDGLDVRGEAFPPWTPLYPW